MKTLNKTLSLALLLAAVPLAAAQAQDEGAAHQAWLKAQKIDIKPTLTIKETQIPADSVPGASGTAPASGTMAPVTPSAAPSSSGGYAPGVQPSGTAPVYPAPIENRSEMNTGVRGQVK